ncbi:MAG: cyclopropane fatty acyl phospholipid synthase [Acidobacteria bacterium]|nr:cyclopropane fatty acyl phospholipid synthase [Acidobacteriota bacterium]
MARRSARETMERILALADIEIGGDRPWDIRVHHEGFYDRVLSQGSLGLGESYMEGWWDSPQLDEFFHRALRADLAAKVRSDWETVLRLLGRTLVNPQRRSKAFEIGERHYDVGNDLYRAMLDRRMVYTCAYWKNAKTLDEAQEAKLDLVCRKLGLQPGQKVFDIGCGWGSFLKYAAENYGVAGVGNTVSKEQVKLGRQLCAGLPIRIDLQDYREIEGRFDHIVSLGMFEHVGSKNYRTFMRLVSMHLADEGLFLLDTIGGEGSMRRTDPWFEKYIFPNSMTPSTEQMAAAIDGLFVMEDWHNFGADYDRTLMAWFRNFDERWPCLQVRYDARFYRMWKYYLLACAGCFRARKSQSWQIVLSKRGVVGGYVSVR